MLDAKQFVMDGMKKQKQKQTNRELWWLPRDFFTFNRDDNYKQYNYDKVRYTFKGYVCPRCSVVFQTVPGAGDEPLLDFPTIGKDRKVCSNCE